MAAVEHEPAGKVAGGGRPLERAVAAAECGVSEDAAPALADDGGAEEARRVVRREVEESLANQVIWQRRHGCFQCSALIGGGDEGSGESEGEWRRLLLLVGNLPLDHFTQESGAVEEGSASYVGPVIQF